MKDSFPNSVRPILAFLLGTVGQLAVAQTSWHFEFTNGLPVKLVWQTQPGLTYNLQLSSSLPAWTQVPGFPKAATNVVMDYSFAPGARGFFWITALPSGQGWQPQALPGLPAGSTFSLAALSALDTNQLWACGSVNPSGDVSVLRTSDGGGTWTIACRSSSLGFFSRLQMISPSTGFAGGTGLRNTSDGGTTWQREQNNIPNPPGAYHDVGPDGYVYGLTAVDASHIWTAGYDGYSAGIIYHRVPERPQPDPLNPNGNTPWWLEWGAEHHGMYGISAVNQTTALAVGYAGFIWMTTDGVSWVQQTSNTGVPLNDVAALSANTAWVVGDGGTILKTTDAGTNWVAQTSGTTENLKKISAVNSSVAWAVGTTGTLLKTTDGGTTWAPQFSGTMAALSSVVAVDTNSAWVVGEGNTILHTIDGGRGAWPAPVITSVTPKLFGADSWSPATVTITGMGLHGGRVTVNFGSTASESVTWINTSTLQALAPNGTAGTLNLTVINEDGQSGTLSNAVTFLPEPLMTAYSPLHGLASGGYQITVDGFNLQTVASAQFYNYTTSEYESLPTTVVNSTRVLVTVPAAESRATGRAMLILHTAETQAVSGNDFWLDPPGGPTFAINSITPRSGPVGTKLTVTGVGFSTNVALTCGIPVTITNRSATQLIGNVPYSSAGLCYVEVVNNGTDYASVDPAFQLTSGTAPAVSQVSPISGSTVGGTSVTLTGSGFQSTDTVTFDGYQAKVVSRAGTTNMVVLSPPHPTGAVSVFIMPEYLTRAVAIQSGGFTYGP